MNNKMIVLFFLLLIVGLFALVKGADLFVDGSSGLARHFRVPGIIIGLTIVACGTSAPELAVSTSAAIQGSNEIALSNVVGSNIFNLLMVLGICAIIHPVPVDRAIMKRDFPISIVVSLAVLILSCLQGMLSTNLFSLKMSDTAGVVSRWEGFLLLGVFILYMVLLIIDARRHPDTEKEEKAKPVIWCIGMILIGLALIIGGGQAVVYSAKEIARAAGLSETLIGLTIVAAGTSLPELVTSIVAARKGETGLAVGNVIGSNLFNMMFILGLSAAIHPVAVNMASFYDMIILIVITLLALLFSFTKRNVSRPEGIIMVCLYGADMVFAILR